MNKSRGFILFCGLCISISSQAKDAPLLCNAINKAPNWSPLKNIQFGSMVIQSDDVELLGTESAEFSGDVNINSTKFNITASAALVDKQLGLFNATGPISYQDLIAKIKSSGLNADFNSSEINLLGAEYQLSQQLGRGSAEKLSINKNEFILSDGSYTTCPIGNEVWSIQADKIILSQEEGWGETYGMTFKVLDTPVLYLPYFTYPISDKRQSGFLIPSFGPSSKYGFEVATPFYWNIAPNFDATITPRYMANQGIQMNSEFRYLTEQHQGLLALEFLNEDKSEKELNERYLVHWQQKSNISEDWRASIDVTNVSDDNYLTDLDSSYANKTETQLNRTGILTYFGKIWQTDVKVQNFEVLGDHLASYSALPQITFNQIKALKWHDFQLTLNGEMSHFRNSNSDNRITEASRFHLEPKIQFNFQDFGWSFLSELSILQTHYQQNINSENTVYEKNINRTLPKIRLHSQLNLERKTNWLVKNGAQTLEPQVQYLYVPTRDQSNIGLYDTTKLQDDFFGLFRDKQFSGVDRIAAANQFTVGATTRIFSEKNDEVFNLSAGQTFYLSDSAKPTNQELGKQKNYNSLFAGEAMLHWHRRWYLGAGIQYDVDGKELIQSHMTLDYKGDNKQLVQLNHRFANDVSDNTIEQIGAFTSIPIADNWQFIASYQRDIEHNRSVEILSGLQYESCCWAIQLTGHRQIETDLNQSISSLEQQNAVFNSGFRLNFVFKGLGGKSNYDAKKLLEQGIFGYRRPYFINN
ncbi:LPS assembly protein LptD [Pseudoalteromonas denitrificans]|uniref:LPS-assembly protein LptD n=1 Tax=Pseudoalteromonas denitrificans DSM 6059 TaxID=1123010 RepID=A0A1I1E4Z3_9GAMM|nr:LPS assembly protein LptD [Pseudoalteromonas denitrificans]SFB80298.1 LPS-assembly protein [Pseudoalteromonas denitrificans DSM 6059]